MLVYFTYCIGGGAWPLLFSHPDNLESRGLRKHVISDKIIPRDPKNSALIPHTESFAQSAS